MTSGRKLVVLLENPHAEGSVHNLDESFAKQVSPLIDHLAKKSVEKTEFEILFLNHEQQREEAPAFANPEHLVELRLKNSAVEFVLTLAYNESDHYHLKHELTSNEIDHLRPELRKLPAFLKTHAATFSPSQNEKLDRLVHSLQFL